MGTHHRQGCIRSCRCWPKNAIKALAEVETTRLWIFLPAPDSNAMGRPCPCRTSPAFPWRQLARNHGWTAGGFCKARRGRGSRRRFWGYRQCRGRHHAIGTAGASFPAFVDVSDAWLLPGSRWNAWMTFRAVLKRQSNLFSDMFRGHG